MELLLENSNLQKELHDLQESYNSLYELVFMGGNKLWSTHQEFISRMQCCDECKIWYDIDDKMHDGTPLITQETNGDYKCDYCTIPDGDEDESDASNS